MIDKWPNLQFPVQPFIEWPRWRAITSRFLILSIANFPTFHFQRKFLLFSLLARVPNSHHSNRCQNNIFLEISMNDFMQRKFFFWWNSILKQLKFDWKIEGKIFANRKKRNIRKNYFETSETLHKKFEQNQFQTLFKIFEKTCEKPKKTKTKTNSEWILFVSNRKKKQNVLGAREAGLVDSFENEKNLVHRKSEQLISTADTIQFPWMSTLNHTYCWCASPFTHARSGSMYIDIHTERERGA